MHLLNSRHFNGAESVAATVMTGMSERWDSVFVSRYGPVGKVLESKGLAYRGVRSLNPLEVQRICREFQPDLIHAHDYRASLVASMLRPPVISHLHNNYPWAKRPGPITLVYGIAMSRFSRVLAVSNSVLEEHHLHKRLAKIGVVVANGIDFEEIALKAVESTLHSDLAFVGRFTPQKDPLAFVRIVEAIAEERPTLALMLGDGELWQECRDKIASGKAKESFRLLGYQTNPYPGIAGSKVCIVPSRWEGFGLVALEAISLGTAVLGRRVGGLGELLATYSPYSICDREEEFIQKAKELLHDDSMRASLVASTRQAILEAFSAKEFVRIVERIYQETLTT